MHGWLCSRGPEVCKYSANRSVTTSANRSVTTSANRSVTTTANRSVTTLVNHNVTTSVKHNITNCVNRSDTTSANCSVNRIVTAGANGSVITGKAHHFCSHPGSDKSLRFRLVKPSSELSSTLLIPLGFFSSLLFAHFSLLAVLCMSQIGFN